MEFGCVHCAPESQSQDVFVDDDGFGYMIAEDAISYEDLIGDNYDSYIIGHFLFCPYCGRKFTPISKAWEIKHE